jgi:hypothetical protein
MSTPTEIYVLLGLSVAHILERIFYYACLAVLHFTKSSCVTTVAKDCLKVEASVESDTDQQLQEHVEADIKQQL